ncbi:metabolism of cobalamin associated Db isoform X2 [Austrofundulus limnaeus]|uniref:Metabolism of cobalamin associated Db isoform X2 n=1 Tax=Austrofundulus limnaeus TaxID=52670 RepID=A0A2I4CZL9_AUSLI|nr:PREDICTED: methylmalonic aciduria and homocystinuria type D homolog, mitochondrial-like isoform X2 [Austrofundulus limnaeus]
MACVLGNRTRLVRYLPGIHALVRCVTRTMSSAACSGPDQHNMAASPLHAELDQCVHLPGFMGLMERKQTGGEERKMLTDVLPPPSSRGRQDFLFHFNEDPSDPVSSQEVSSAQHYFSTSGVECAVQSCPQILKKDFCSMFPEAPSSDMMVVTVTQKTQNDMSSWSPVVEQERDQMLDKFVAGAQEICLSLQKQGFWADFIDPSSGLAYFGAYTNNTLFETDERYGHLGFQIEDLGCCRVIRHSLWGTRVFVGTICTNAPPTSLVKNLQ